MLKLTVEELFIDSLITQKYMISAYEQFVKEASNENLIDLLLGNLEDTIKDQHDIFMEMKERNLYPVPMAEKQKMEQAIITLDQKTKNYAKDFKESTTSKK